MKLVRGRAQKGFKPRKFDPRTPGLCCLLKYWHTQVMKSQTKQIYWCRHSQGGRSRYYVSLLHPEVGWHVLITPSLGISRWDGTSGQTGVECYWWPNGLLTAMSRLWMWPAVVHGDSHSMSANKGTWHLSFTPNGFVIPGKQAYRALWDHWHFKGFMITCYTCKVVILCTSYTERSPLATKSQIIFYHSEEQASKLG